MKRATRFMVGTVFAAGMLLMASGCGSSVSPTAPTASAPAHSDENWGRFEDSKLGLSFDRIIGFNTATPVGLIMRTTTYGSSKLLFTLPMNHDEVLSPGIEVLPVAANVTKPEDIIMNLVRREGKKPENCMVTDNGSVGETTIFVTSTVHALTIIAKKPIVPTAAQIKAAADTIAKDFGELPELVASAKEPYAKELILRDWCGSHAGHPYVGTSPISRPMFHYDAAVAGSPVIYLSPASDPYELFVRSITFWPLPTPASTTITVVLPKNIEKYVDAVSEYATQGGDKNPAATWPFQKSIVEIPYTSSSVWAAAEYAAEKSGATHSSNLTSIIYLKIVGGTAYVVRQIDIDGYAGVGVALAKSAPVIEKTLLAQPGIKHVIFDVAPGDSKDDLIKLLQ